MKTLYIMITCCLEQGRKDILKHVVDNLITQANFDEINSNFIVFDNASTMDGIIDLLSPFNCVLRSNKNVGYWTALRYIANFASSNFVMPKYVYSIESDCVHDRIERIKECEEFLDVNPDVGMIRTQEFIVSKSQLYDKDKPRPDSRIYAWQRQTNRFRNNERVFFEHTSGNIYKTNFTPVVCGLSRFSVFSAALEHLSHMPNMSEADYQGFVDSQYSRVGLYDHGLFNSKLSFMNINTVAGSRPNTLVPGYRSTQHDKIDADGSYTVVRVK